MNSLPLVCEEGRCVSLIDVTNHRLRHDVARACRSEARRLITEADRMLGLLSSVTTTSASTDEDRARELCELADRLDGGR